jgi:hypothetical protein
VGSLKMNTALEYSTRVVQEGDRRCKKSTLNDLAYLTPLRIPLMNPLKGYSLAGRRWGVGGVGIEIRQTNRTSKRHKQRHKQTEQQTGQAEAQAETQAYGQADGTSYTEQTKSDRQACTEGRT